MGTRVSGPLVVDAWHFFPSRFAQVRSVASVGLTHLLPGPATGGVYIVEGIDVSVSGAAGQAQAWYETDAGAKLYFLGPPPAGAMVPAQYVGTWRGSLPVATGESVTFGIDTALAADLTIVAWGRYAQVPAGVSL